MSDLDSTVRVALGESLARTAADMRAHNAEIIPARLNMPPGTYATAVTLGEFIASLEAEAARLTTEETP